MIICRSSNCKLLIGMLLIIGNIKYKRYSTFHTRMLVFRTASRQYFEGGRRSVRVHSRPQKYFATKKYFFFFKNFKKNKYTTRLILVGKYENKRHFHKCGTPFFLIAYRNRILFVQLCLVKLTTIKATLIIYIAGYLAI